MITTATTLHRNRSVLEQLESDWASNHQTYRRPTAWQDEPALHGYTPAQLVADAHNQRHRDNTERALTALIGRARTDDLAALTTMHILLPATKALLARTHGSAGQALALIEDLWQIIRLYPCHRRGPVSANVKLDLLKAYLAEQYGPIRNASHQRRPISIAATIHLDALDNEPRPVDETASSAGAELIGLLCQAVIAGHLDRSDAALIARCRIADVTADELGAAHGVQPQSVRRQRQRAEQRLRQHAAAA